MAFSGPTEILTSYWSLTPDFKLLVYLSISFLVVLACLARPGNSNLRDVPLFDSGVGYSPMQLKAKKDFVFHSLELFAQARKLFFDRPYRIITDAGEIIMLPLEICEEIKNNPHLSFGSAFAHDFHGDIHGFEGASLQAYKTLLLQILVRKQLTRSLPNLSKPLAKETINAISLNFGDNEEWHDMQLKPAMLDLVARVTSRVFTGEELCRNEAWLRVTCSYTVSFFIAGTHLRMVPRPLRPIGAWLLPSCRKLRREFAEARAIVGPVIAQRRASARSSPAKHDDMIDWADEEAEARNIRYDPATLQLTLALVAVHTTSDLSSQVVLQLAAHPEFLAPLREEVARVLGEEGGFTKAAFAKMRLLDSTLKETQRHKPPGAASMRRRVEKEVTLSNGLTLKVGDRISIDTYRMGDPELYPDPTTWDPYRFLRMRQEHPEKETEALMGTTSPDHLAFGHGLRACTGRWFAANEIKILLCHLLIKYDWKLAPGVDISPLILGMTIASNPTAHIQIRRRKLEEMELDIDSL